jgi:hypothetical protein
VNARAASRGLRSVDAYTHTPAGFGSHSLAPLSLLIEDFVERVADRLAQKLEERGLRPSDARTPELLSVPEAAAVLRCKPQRVYDLRSAGRLPRTTEGGRAVVRRSDLERLVIED